MTLSFHHLAKGFFPGAGHCSETGAGTGRGFNLNVPLKEGRPNMVIRVVPSLSIMLQGEQPFRTSHTIWHDPKIESEEAVTAVDITAIDRRRRLGRTEHTFWHGR